MDKQKMTKKIMTFIGILVLIPTAFFAAKGISDSSYDAPDVTVGETAYLANCLACHEERGRGDGPASHAMPVKPDDIYQELTNPFGFKAELIDSILTGDNGQDGTMPAFKGVLTEKEIVDIFGYITSINTEGT